MQSQLFLLRMRLPSCEKEKKQQNLKYIYVVHHIVVNQTTLLVAH